MRKVGSVHGVNISIWEDTIGKKAEARIGRFLSHVFEASGVQKGRDGDKIRQDTDGFTAKKIIMGMRLDKFGAGRVSDPDLLRPYILRPCIKVTQRVLADLVRCPNMRHFAGKPVLELNKKNVWEFYYVYGYC